MGLRLLFAATIALALLLKPWVEATEISELEEPKTLSNLQRALRLVRDTVDRREARRQIAAKKQLAANQQASAVISDIIQRLAPDSTVKSEENLNTPSPTQSKAEKEVQRRELAEAQEIRKVEMRVGLLTGGNKTVQKDKPSEEDGAKSLDKRNTKSVRKIATVPMVKALERAAAADVTKGLPPQFPKALRFQQSAAAASENTNAADAGGRPDTSFQKTLDMMQDHYCKPTGDQVVCKNVKGLKLELAKALMTRDLGSLKASLATHGKEFCGGSKNHKARCKAFKLISAKLPEFEEQSAAASETQLNSRMKSLKRAAASTKGEDNSNKSKVQILQHGSAALASVDAKKAAAKASRAKTDLKRAERVAQTAATPEDQRKADEVVSQAKAKATAEEAERKSAKTTFNLQPSTILDANEIAQQHKRIFTARTHSTEAANNHS